MTSKVPWKLVVAVGIAGVVLGFYGLTVQAGADRWNVLVVLTNAWKSLALLVMESDPRPETDHWSLVVGRILAPAATIGALLRLLLDYVSVRWNLWRLSWWSNHTVVVGCGEYGRALLAHQSGKVVILDVVPPDINAVLSAERNDDVRRHTGDGRDVSTLERVGIQRCANVVILTGNDATSLDILARVLECRSDSARPLRVVVRIGNEILKRHLGRDDEFVRVRSSAGQGQHIEVIPFNPHLVAAQSMLQAHPLSSLADLRAQSRVRLVVIGWDHFVLEVIEQLIKLAPYKAFDVPRVDLFVERPDAVRSELAAVQPAVFSDIRRSVGDPPERPSQTTSIAQPRLLELYLHELDHRSGVPTAEQIVTIEPAGCPTVTAILVSLGFDDVSGAAALALRQRCHYLARWRAPIFVRMLATNALADLIRERATAPDLAQRIVPVGTIDEICRRQLAAEELEEAAQAFHAAHRQRNHDSPASESLAPWPDLPQTYRIANRRAVEHLPVKLASAGFVIIRWPLKTPGLLDIIAEPGERRTLAELEHKSWEIDRVLDDWRHGQVRDDTRRVHPAIGVPFDELDEVVGMPLRRFDHEQIETAALLLANRSGPITVKRDVRVGLVGHNSVSPDDLARILEGLDTILGAFTEQNRANYVSLLTPLAPGADLILTELFLERLSQAGIDHRLIVVRTLPPTVVTEYCVRNATGDGVWSVQDARAPMTSRPAAHSPEALKRAMLHRMTELEGARPANMIADLQPVGKGFEDWYSDEGLRLDAYRAANAYVAERSHMLVAFLDDQRDGKPGGTQEAVEWASDPTRIPDRYVTTLTRAQRSAVEVKLLGARRGMEEEAGT